MTGNPKFYSSFAPQPVDAEAFVAVCQPVQQSALQQLTMKN
eukprot:CAMPEP_0184293042 /NCGR_PEP_ID=MMETSP1049-20130417/4641_1 /TAXON_ID=77928 /ORGANISM="Proteomonas sulcata, Strain CCMP704" /LENGTH=40 /DNA_ID= /DNA_START= /DNA_END= /DNA_ORIENTATION=